MAQHFKIQIPKPCQEDWEQMTPDANGRFCSSCAKSVVDFSQMKTAEIQAYFAENREKQLCGMFSDNHLDSVVIAIPTQVLFSQTQFHKIFLLALFVTMGTTLFSCADDNGNKRPIDTIEVTDSNPIERRTMGIPLPQKNDSLAFAEETIEKCAENGKTKGEVMLRPTAAKINVYKDSITMSGGK
jgi:hypothetical protein